MKKSKLFPFCLILLLIPFAVVNGGSAKSVADEWRYDIECAGAGSEGTYLVKVWSYAKKATIPTEIAKRNAVHGVLFKGFSGAQGCVAQKALIRDAGVQHEKADFFATFFGGEGTYLKYASVTSSSPEVIKVSKKEYKIGYILSISKDQLRKDLEAAGIIKGLSSGF